MDLEDLEKEINDMEDENEPKKSINKINLLANE